MSSTLFRKKKETRSWVEILQQTNRTECRARRDSFGCFASQSKSLVLCFSGFSNSQIMKLLEFPQEPVGARNGLWKSYHPLHLCTVCTHTLCSGENRVKFSWGFYGNFSDMRGGERKNIKRRNKHELFAPKHICRLMKRFSNEKLSQNRWGRERTFHM